MRIRALARFAMLFLVGSGAAGMAHAQEPSGFELRLGGAVHDPASRESGTADATALVILPRMSAAALAPRIALGGSLNLAGATSLGHAGLLWQFPITDRVFAEVGLGLALHNGKAIQSAERNAMGCAGAFRESLGLGYKLDARWSVIASLEHLSNAGLCRRNRGLTNLGISVGYSF